MAEKQAIYQMRITPGMEYIRGPEGQRAEQEVLTGDKDRCSRVLINIVGRERQGKTSLRKMLSGENFNEDEESTVGIDQELVDTTGLQPESSWSTVDLHEANLEEFDIILGKHVLKRLKGRPERFCVKKALAPVVCFMKIAIITYLFLAVYFSAVSFECLIGYPWFVCVVIGIFCGSGLAFGTREGFGIAVGIFHQVLLCESLLRWKVEDWFLELRSRTGFTCAIFAGFLFYGIVESIAALSFGMSLGVGVALFFCLAQPPEFPESQGLRTLLSHHLLLFVLGCYIGLGSLRYRNILFFVVVPILAIALQILPEKHSFLLMCGVGCGHFHGIFLAVGQNTFYLLNMNIHRITDNRMCRRFLRHVIGFLPGIVLQYIFNWDVKYFSLTNVLPAMLLLLTIEILNHLTGNRSPKCQTTNPSKILTARVKHSSLKLVFRDFAGHPLYYSSHHLYMTGKCMYILVFNLVHARTHFDSALSYLLQWLYSIYVHNSYPDVRVFIVGSHRDDPSLSRSVVKLIGKNLKESLPRQFHNIVIWNNDDTPLFPVENSLRDETDEDHLNLKNRILKEVKFVNLERCPVRYFYFFKLIESYRKDMVLIKKYDDIYHTCRNNECRVQSEEEFDELLMFFAKTGEIIHNTKDNVLREFVIFDPKAVVRILSELITVPKMCKRARNLIRDWELLDTFGVCSETLFRENLSKLYTSSDAFDGFEKVVYVLERFNLLCKIQTKPGINAKDRFYLIPALLPKHLPYRDNVWDDNPSDEFFLVQFSPTLPMSAFLKLVCKCAAYDNSIISSDSSIIVNACQTKALLTYKNVYSYKLETLGPVLEESSNSLADDGSNSISSTEMHSFTFNKEFLRIVIRCGEDNDFREMLSLLWESLKRIIQRDFVKCRLKLGVRCPCDPPHQNPDVQSGIHLLPLMDDQVSNCDITDNQDILTGDFWCRGRKVSVRNGKATVMFGHASRSMHAEYNIATLLSDLPYTITSRVCDCLNVPNALGRDWTCLAGMLGKTTRDVELLKFRCPKDPCDALLQDWVSRQPQTTIRDLIAVLSEMQRMDAVAELGI